MKAVFWRGESGLRTRSGKPSMTPTPEPPLAGAAQALFGGTPQPFFQYPDADSNVTAGSANIRTIVVNLEATPENQPTGIWQAGAVSVQMSDRIRLTNR